MGKVAKTIGQVALAPAKFVAQGAGKLLDVPILGDAIKLGSNFIPGVGPLVSGGLQMLDMATGEGGQQGPIAGAMAGYNGFNPQQQQQQQAQFSMQPTYEQGNFSGDASERYYDPWATQADYNLADTATGYGTAFREMSEGFGGYQDRAFDIYENTMGDKGGMDWGEVERITSKMGSSAAGGYFGGDAGMEGTYQNQVQNAMAGMGESGFGASGGGMLGNAMMNAGKQGGQIFSDTFDRNLGQIGGITQQDLASQRQAAIAGLQNFTGAQLGAMESAYGADMSAGEVPFGRGMARNERWFNEQAQPELLKHLRYIPWWERQLQTMGEMGAAEIGGALPGAVGGLVKNLWPSGGGDTSTPGSDWRLNLPQSSSGGGGYDTTSVPWINNNDDNYWDQAGKGGGGYGGGNY